MSYCYEELMWDGSATNNSWLNAGTVKSTQLEEKTWPGKGYVLWKRIHCTQVLLTNARKLKALTSN